MKTIVSITFLLMYYSTNAQIDTQQQKMLPMSETYQKPYTLGSVYYQKEQKEPFTGILYGKYDNGKYLTLQEYKDGVGNGTWINFYENGNPKEIGTYVENRVEGPVQLFYENGTRKATGTYKHWRKKVGTWKFYKKDGSLEKTVDYDH